MEGPFQSNSLYLNSNVDFSPQNVACGAAWIRLLYELILADAGWDKLQRAIKLEERLKFNNYTGKEKGQMIRKVRDGLIQEFSSYSAIPPQILKGKNPKRVFWAIVDVDNILEIEKIVDSLIR